MVILSIPMSTLFSHSVVNLLVVNLFTYLSSVAAQGHLDPRAHWRRRCLRGHAALRGKDGEGWQAWQPRLRQGAPRWYRRCRCWQARRDQGAWFHWQGEGQEVNLCVSIFLLSILRVFSRNLLHVTCYSHAQQEANKMYEEEHENKPNE